MHLAFFLVLSALAPAAPAQQSAPLSQSLERLKGLPPLEQVRELQELSASGPVGRSLASAVVKPELIGLRREELEFRLGPEQVQDMATLAVTLQVDARGDERVMAGLEALARRLASQGSLSRLDFGGDWFDASAQQETPLGRATAWPSGDPAGYKQRVHTITSRDGDILINGKTAEHFRDKRVEGGLTSEILVHPDDPGLLVRVYHSPGSLEAFERNYARVESLEPLSAAGAAPKLIEHGEMPIPGRGRVYFHVQKLLKDAKLEDLAPRERSLEAVRRLFERMTKAGLSLLVPGSDQSWLLSHIVQSKTPGGGARAWVIGAAVEPGEPAELAAHYDMLLSLLSSSPVGKRLSGGLAAASAPQVPLPSDKLVSLEDASGARTLVLSARDKGLLPAILKRYKLDGVPSQAGIAPAELALRFDSERAVASAATALLPDPGVAQVRVDQTVRDHIERQSAKALGEMLRLLPESAARNGLILKIPATAYAKTEGPDVAAILSLVSKDAASADGLYPSLPREAWLRLTREDAARLIKQWLAINYQTAAKTVAGLWIAARYGGSAGAPGDAGADVLELLRLMPEWLASPTLAAVWPAIGSRITGPRRQALIKRLPEDLRPSKGLRDLFGSGLAPEALLDALHAFLRQQDALSAHDLVYLLQKMPRRVNWGVPTAGDGARRFYDRARQLGIAVEVNPTGWLYSDVRLAAEAIQKTKATPEDSEELAKLPELAKSILADSRNAGATADDRARLENYLFEEIRRMSAPSPAKAADGAKKAGGRLSPEVTMIFNSSLTPEARLNAIESALERSKALSPRELVYVLERMPRGVSWGWRDPKTDRGLIEAAARFAARMKSLGINHDWKPADKFFHIDVVLATKAIEKTSGRAGDAGLLKQVPGLVQKILDASGEVKDKPKGYATEIQSLAFEELRRLNDRLKPAARAGRGKRPRPLGPKKAS